METTENPKLAMASSCEVCGLEDKTGTQKISVSDNINGFQYTTEKSDSFVIDMERFSHGGCKDMAANSRITLQRSLSRKGSQRGNEKKINSNANPNDRETTVANSSPRAAQIGSGTPEKAVAVVAGSTDHASSSPQVHHQITITTGNISNTSTTESRFTIRKNSFRRSSPPWVLDPKKVLLFFATLSSIGTVLLIFFTLSIGKLNGDETALD